MNTNQILDIELAGASYVVYDQFHDPKDASLLLRLLKSNKIPHEVEMPKQLMDTILVGEAHVPKMFVKLYPYDFQRVNRLIEDNMLQLIREGKIDLKKHFLHQYTDEELLDVLGKPDEWNFDTTVIARYLLHSRGVEISEQEVRELREKRLNEIRTPRQGAKAWTIALLLFAIFNPLILLWWYVGYLASLTICFGMGYYYWMDVTTDLNGEKFYTFDRKTRYRGKMIFILTILSNLLFWPVFLWKFS